MASNDDAANPALRAGSRLTDGVAIAVALLATFLASGFWFYTVDDAFITFRYSWNAAHGQGLVFNPGEAVEGYSNPTWTLILAWAIGLGADPLLTAKVVGLACFGGGVLIAARSAAATAGGGWRSAGVAALTGALAGCSLPWAFWATEGLETPLYGILLTAAVARLAAEGAHDPPWSAVLAGFAGISRPEGLLFAAAIGLARLLRVRHRSEAGAVAIWAALSLAPSLFWLAYRVTTYDDVVPNTWYHKGGAASWKEVTDYLGPWLAREWPLPLAAGVGAVAWLLRDWRGAVPVVVPLAAGVAFLLRVGGDWMPNQRFLAPIVPLLALAAGGGVGAGLQTVGSRWGVGGLVVLALTTGIHAPRALAMRIIDHETEGVVELPREAIDWPPRAWDRGFGGANFGVSVWLLQHIPAGVTLAYSEVGLPAYVGDWRVVDLVGLTDRDLAGATGLNVAQRVAFVEAMRPEWIVLRRNGVQVIRILRASEWLPREYVTEEVLGRLMVGRRKDTPEATPEQAWDGLTRALDRQPRFGGFHQARIEFAADQARPEWLATACAGMAEWFPGRMDGIRQCRARGARAKLPAE